MIMAILNDALKRKGFSSILAHPPSSSDYFYAVLCGNGAPTVVFGHGSGNIVYKPPFSGSPENSITT